MASSYISNFAPTPKAEEVMRSGRIISADETPAMMVERVVGALTDQERLFSGDADAVENFSSMLGSAIDRGEIVMSTPIMTNAGRYIDRPLTACTVPTINLQQFHIDDLKREITVLHEQGMGTGFNLNDVENPTEMLGLLNAIAQDSARSGRENRPVGNMAVLSVYHPRIQDFIDAKVSAPLTGESWKFNISVDVDSNFMHQLEAGGDIVLRDGAKVNAGRLFDAICTAATACADPGLVFLDRMNERNPLPGLGEYKTTAPCAEVGLIEGETCQFGYINVGKFVSRNGSEVVVDYRRLQPAVNITLRALDNALEISSSQFITARSRYVAEQKRKVGIGVCGIADALTQAGLPYDSIQARILMQDILSFINFASKEATIRLAEERGSCGAMHNSLGNRHLSGPLLIDTLYGDRDTHTVLGSDWRNIARRIAGTRRLRNITTIALPPTGRSALVIDASTGIEPHFNLEQANSGTLETVRQDLQRIFGATAAAEIVAKGYTLPEDNEFQTLFASAREIDPMGHVAMAAALQEFTDEAISKTINLSGDTTYEQVADVYARAYKSGMSGVAVYIDGTYKFQPKEI